MYNKTQKRKYQENKTLIHNFLCFWFVDCSDVPYIVRLLQDGQLETLGAQHYGGKLRHPVTAHPKV